MDTREKLPALAALVTEREYHERARPLTEREYHEHVDQRRYELDGADLRREPIEVRNKHPTEEPARRASERAHGAHGGRRGLSARLQDGPRGNCLEAPGVAV